MGVAFSGVKLDAPARTDAILSAHMLAPFDDCGGHVNLHAGYHMHAVTDKAGCHKTTQTLSGHAPQIGLAMDGYPIHARLNAAGANAILTCHKGEVGCNLESSDQAFLANQKYWSPRTARRPSPPEVSCPSVGRLLANDPVGFIF